MTKKHFIALADVIKQFNGFGCDTKFTYSQILALADFCGSQNELFDRDRWLGYIKGECGNNGGKVKVNA